MKCEYCGPITFMSCVHYREEIAIGIAPGSKDSVISLGELEDLKNENTRLKEALKEIEQQPESEWCSWRATQALGQPVVSESKTTMDRTSLSNRGDG